ncbi:MAG: hypothetical protein V3T22_03525, partial [Planctomycetota bacterium]
AGGAHLHAIGSAVVADNNFNLETQDIPAGALTVHIFGPTNVQTPWGDGYRCVTGALLQRYRVLQADANGVVRETIDLSVPPALWYFVPAATFHFQNVYRDAAGGPAGFNSSDAVSVTFN